MNVVIRPAQTTDAPHMVALLNPIIRASNLTAMQREVSVEEQVEFIRSFPAAGIFNVAQCPRTNRLLGMQDVVPANDGPVIAEVSTFVALDMLRHGIGAALMQETIPQATRRGFSRLRAVIGADNLGAIAFYQSWGFSPIDQPGSDRIVAERALD